MSSHEIFDELGDRLAHKLANESCRNRFGFTVSKAHRDHSPCDVDPRYWDVYSAAVEAIRELIYENSHRLEHAILRYARLRVDEYLSYEDAVVNKSAYFVEKERRASEAAGEPERNHYLHQKRLPQRYEDRFDPLDTTRSYDFFEAHREDDANPLATCDDDTDREIVRRLTETQQTCDQIAKALGIKDYKERSRRIKHNARYKDPMANRKPRMADPEVLQKITPLPHDNCSPQSGCPVARCKDYCCDDARDRLLIDLYRDRLSVERIEQEMDCDAEWIENRLGILAYRYTTM